MQNNALAAIRQFWAEILGRETTTLSQLALTLRTLSGLEAKAHRLYRVMLER